MSDDAARLLAQTFLTHRVPPHFSLTGYQFNPSGNGTGLWSNEGCVRLGGDLNHSVCLCNHLTNFAILMQVVPLQLSRGHQVALSSITYIGCALSILCLTITLLTFAVLSSVSTMRTQRYHIHTNLASAVLLAQVLLLASFQLSPATNFMVQKSPSCCQDISAELFGVRLAFLQCSHSLFSSRLTAKAVAVLLPILGSSWIFGILAVNAHALVFQYIFAVFNSLQGFFMFLFHCLLNSEVRAAFKHKTKVWSLSSSSTRNINVKPFNSDIMSGNRPGTSPTQLHSWDRSCSSGHRVDLSAV
ncbi:hypothetical protein Nmel_015235 [Mimus melanotis]